MHINKIRGSGSVLKGIGSPKIAICLCKVGSSNLGERKSMPSLAKIHTKQPSGCGQSFATSFHNYVLLSLHSHYVHELLSHVLSCTDTPNDETNNTAADFTG